MIVIHIVCIIGGIDRDGVSTFDFIEDVGCKFFESSGRKGSEFLSGLIPFGMETILWSQKRLICCCQLESVLGNTLRGILSTHELVVDIG
jgi:hypothetical protein